MGLVGAGEKSIVVIRMPLQWKRQEGLRMEELRIGRLLWIGDRIL
jgi:hypothetical protein